MTVKKFIFIVFMAVGLRVSAQPMLQQLPEMSIGKWEVESNLRFLASDKLEGRDTGSEGLSVAAAYLSGLLESYGVKKAPGLSTYFQEVLYEKSSPPSEADLTVGNKTYKYREDFYVLSGNLPTTKTTGVFAGYGWVDEAKGQDDYKGLNVKGKVVFVLFGNAEAGSPFAGFQSVQRKIQLAKERGAVALFELGPRQFPWGMLSGFLSGPSVRLKARDAALPNMQGFAYGMLKNEMEGVVTAMKDKKAKITVSSSGYQSMDVNSPNVIGIIEGTDPQLKNEYVLLSAHYDHVGRGSGRIKPEDDIFNGARDNAMGVVAMMAAARTLAQTPPKRSVIVLAIAGEEKGLLGSKYYAEHPIVPLEKTVFNMNTDGAGYNDTQVVSVIGYGRTGTDKAVEQGLTPFGLKVFADPAPEQGLFDRSDNVSFAVKGVPCLTFSLGFTSFDEEISKYYHQVTDGPETVDYDYFLKFCKAFAHTARNIADMEQRPVWVAGDKYEPAGRALYKEK